MSLFLVGFGIPLDKSGDYTSITITGLTGLCGLVGLTTGWTDASMARGD